MTLDADQNGTGPQALRGDIAIVGMACLFAGAPNLHTYWQNIISKFDAVSDPPADEWDPALFYDPESKSNDRVYCKRGGYIGDLSHFRPLDFGIMPVTVDGGEPDQWLALRVAQEALADAGYSELTKEHERTEVILGKGTYVNRGNLTVGYHAMLIEYFIQVLKNLHPEYSDAEVGEIKKELKAGLPPFSADTAPALIGNIIAGRIANRLDFMGPSFTVDAACASALLAIEIGVRDLLSRKCDVVLAGGANVNAPLPTISLFCQLGALSRQEKIRPFDKNADGTLLGEGLGMVVLKRREDAERDGDRIYAIVKGVGLASDGRALHVMAPRVEGEELALRRAYEMAGVAPESVELIEAHGTATPVGDVVEMQALGRVFGERKSALPACAVGSVKSMIGHAMPAAGIAGVIKAALSLYHRVIPPTLHCEEPNPALHLENTPFYINTETRPWIHGGETPRRAGVNSFGFGGINGHVVLEENTREPAAHSHQLLWESEVCILEAASRGELIERGERLRDYLARPEAVALKDLAYTLNTRLEGLPSRLALVATSKEDLEQKLARALGRLADPKCAQIKDNAGIYFFAQPFDGKLAFLFPGEGAQYPNMLLDLCLHFPEVRACFDLADRALIHASRSILPSDFIFPRSIVGDAERSAAEKALWQIDGAVESVMIGSRAIWTLLRHLEIRPDVIVGHSTGDYSAMLAANIIDLSDQAYVEAIVQWNKAHRRLTERMTVPEATLIAVAADSATVASILETVGGDLSIAMDNCPHQSVLVGTKAAADEAIEQLRRRGIIYEILPFDRPYHTALFRDYAEGAGTEFFARLPISTPKTEIYSCTTAARYPSDIEEIRKLFVAHWVQPVLFTETIRKMYDDGVRLFVEAGPRGNLTAFISDILRGRPHLAMPANLPRRSGITQINHLVGALAAQRVGMRLDYLYARREPAAVDWENAAAPSGKRASAGMKLSLALPPMKVSPRPKKEVSPVSNGISPGPKNGRMHDAPPHQAHEPMHLHPNPVDFPARKAVAELPSASGPPAAAALAPKMAPAMPASPARAGARSSTAVMQEYLKSMDAFLDVEAQVMGAFLNRKPGVQPINGGAAAAPSREFPLLGEIQSLVPGQELTALRQLRLDEDIFLRDHALGGEVSVTDPQLQPLIVLPLTMSMEILAEAAATLMPGQVLVGMRDIKAQHWIRVDAAPVTLQISARRIGPATPEVSVQIHNLSETGANTNANTTANKGPVIEGVAIFADHYPVPPAASRLELTSRRISQLAAADLYGSGRMFHGPCFQGVVNIERSGQNGLIGQLQTLPSGSLFQSIKQPHLVTDPVLLDAAGQLVGFWSAEYLERGFVVFPYHLQSLRIYGPNRPPGERLTCSLNLKLTPNETMRSDIEIVRADGAVWMQLEGWADRRFDPPRKFHRAWVAPSEATMSDRWLAPLAGVEKAGELECCRLDAFFPPGAGLWKELWASLILSRRERQEFHQQTAPEKRQLEWLSGRTAAKDAIRIFLRKRYGLNLLPADIEITQDEHRRPIAGGAWAHQLRAVPELSLSHSGGAAAAVVCEGGAGRHVGIDIQAVREMKTDLEAAALNPSERALLNALPDHLREEWILRLWCVKEAVSKALGRGLMEGPSSVRILDLDAQTGMVHAAPHGQLADAVPGAVGQRIRASTLREGSYIASIAVYQERTA